MRILSGRWYRELDHPVPLTGTGIKAIERIIQEGSWTDIDELDWGPYRQNGTAIIEWQSCVGNEVAVFDWEAS